MDDLISRAYVLAEYDRQHKGPPGGARKIMEEAPAVGAVPVTHGRWNIILNPFWDAECSECGYTKKNGWEWRFCPNCGAMMDAKEATEYGQQDEN